MLIYFPIEIQFAALTLREGILAIESHMVTFGVILDIRDPGKT